MCHYYCLPVTEQHIPYIPNEIVQIIAVKTLFTLAFGRKELLVRVDLFCQSGSHLI